MDKIGLILMLSSLFLACVSGRRVEDVDSPRIICQGKEKIIKLHFFVQDMLAGPNATVLEVARSPIPKSATSFGQIRVLDNLITAGPEYNSKKLGRAQGLITSADFGVSALNMNLNFYFTAGKYKGSTLTLLGRNEIMTIDRELPIVAGTGAFRRASGFAISNTYSFDTVEVHGVLEYTIYVFTPADSFGILQMVEHAADM